MPRFNTANLLDELDYDTACLRQTASTEFVLLSDAQLLQSPAPGQWSIAQCLEHLNSYGHYYLPAMETAILDAEKRQWVAKADFTSSWLGHFFTQSMRPQTDGTVRTKMKAVGKHRPAPTLDARQVLTEFIRQQDQMIYLLQQAQRIDIGRVRISISIASWLRLTLGDTFRFMIAHAQRHVQQALRVQRTLFLAHGTGVED